MSNITGLLFLFAIIAGYFIRVSQEKEQKDTSTLEIVKILREILSSNQNNTSLEEKSDNKQLIDPTGPLLDAVYEGVEGNVPEASYNLNELKEDTPDSFFSVHLYSDNNNTGFPDNSHYLNNINELYSLIKSTSADENLTTDKMIILINYPYQDKEGNELSKVEYPDLVRAVKVLDEKAKKMEISLLKTQEANYTLAENIAIIMEFIENEEYDKAKAFIESIV